ncbi:glycerophosphodiester phosphodiesterase [Pontibacter harenae]|uniref:glycerophosphodiester phosphodiesterase n=1 Tax=Pontibacter harenae TaxID=2894083 RepID=UPI001E3F3B21|nr:glycerophosphodiester phosphodiesterase family protein [Pontibacter harenae]MCC9167350.1 glycerophosphodiester phosphodiesterase [Pontibacter harenae]
MRKTTLLITTFVFCWLLSGTFATAQPMVKLTNYTYSPQRASIGKIVSKNATQPKVKLIGESAKLFKIDRNNNLLAQKAFANNNAKWHDVVIEFAITGGTKRDTMRIVKDQFIQNKVIAHRGAWKNTGATENSIAALHHAIKLGCEGSEFDVHMSADSVLFINHDPTVHGVPIEQSQSEELSKMKLENGKYLPTLEAYLKEGMKQNTTKLILEIKPSVVSKERSIALAEKVVALVHESKAQGWVDYISFDYDILRRVLELDSDAKVSYLKGDKSPEELQRDNFYGFDYHFSVLQKQENWIKEAHERNLTVNAWTVNAPNVMDWLLERNADFITTNEPELLLQKVANLKQSAGK